MPLHVLAESPTWRVLLEPDEDAPSPLGSDEPFVLVSWSRDVPGTVPTPDDDPTAWAKRWLKRHSGGLLWPVWAYRHGDIALRLGDTPFAAGFPDPAWDVGFVGYGVLTAATLRREWQNDANRARAYIEGALAIYAQWLNGDCWGYRIERRDDPDEPWTCIDSCFGFYGSDWTTNGMAESWPCDVQRQVAAAS